MVDTEAPYRKCSVRDGRFVEPCKSLVSCFDGHWVGHGRALYLMELTDLKSFKPTRSMVILRMGEHQKGIVLNCCPFCGARIDAPASYGDPAPRASEETA